MSAHNPNNSQCDLHVYGPDPGDGSVRCTCDEDAPVEPATTPREGPPSALRPDAAARAFPYQISEAELNVSSPAGPHVVTLTGRAAASHVELREAGREYRLALEVVRRTEARYKAALDAHMQEIQ